MNWFKMCLWGGLLLVTVSVLVLILYVRLGEKREKIGVLFVDHGSMDVNTTRGMWDCVATMFSYDHNHAVHKYVLWNSRMWSAVLDMETTEWAREFMLKYDFEYERIGGCDPAISISEAQLAKLKAELDKNLYGLEFEVDYAGWIGDRPEHFPYPRFIYYPPPTTSGKDNVTYCGEFETEDVILEFDAGTAEFTEEATLTGQTSGATALIDEVTVDSGSWAGGDAAGFLSFSNVSGTFEDNEIIVDNETSPGSATANGSTKWPDCYPERYNVDGPVERLLKAGVSRIIVVDLTMSGIRFHKTFDVVQMAKKVLDKWNGEHGTSIPLIWINDYSNLMERSYPTEPEGWTRSLGYPTVDLHVLLKGGPNPMAEDPEIAELHVEGIEAGMSDTVSDAETGVVLFYHLVYNHNEVFDPKINDTLIVNENIKSQLLERHPDMDPDNIVGAVGGNVVLNPENGLLENSRDMRGERVHGYAWLYESDKQRPDAPWCYRYWDALEYLKDRGVKHIVIGFTHVCTSSVLDMIEVPNQFGKEIGIKTWAKWGTWDYVKYPSVGHPFADYWGNWVYKECDGQPCCFTMGGCGDPSRLYPPPRQTPMDKEMNVFDPSLAYDLSDYGHLGYDPAMGSPDPNAPVQDQYTGTWDMYSPFDDDPRVGEILAKHVLNTAVNPMVYLTNDELEGVEVGESVIWEAHVVSGTPDYSYEWSIKKEGASDWSTMREGSSSWVWTPGNEDEGSYDVRCKVTDVKGGIGEVVWEGFKVSA